MLRMIRGSAEDRFAKCLERLDINPRLSLNNTHLTWHLKDSSRVSNRSLRVFGISSYLKPFESYLLLKSYEMATQSTV
jgi:hypothetical protein